MTECACSSTVNATIPNTIYNFNGVKSSNGDVTFTGQICPNCFVEGSALTFTFTQDSPARIILSHLFQLVFHLLHAVLTLLVYNLVLVD